MDIWYIGMDIWYRNGHIWYIGMDIWYIEMDIWYRNGVIPTGGNSLNVPNSKNTMIHLWQGSHELHQITPYNTVILGDMFPNIMGYITMTTTRNSLELTRHQSVAPDRMT